MQYPRILTFLLQERRIFYASMVASEDEETQKNGGVFVVFAPKKQMDPSMALKCTRLNSALPVRYSSFHVCFDPVYHKMHASLMAVALYAVTTFCRLRARSHLGKMIRAFLPIQ
jgi:hypothetical protein